MYNALLCLGRVSFPLFAIGWRCIEVVTRNSNKY